MKSDKSLDNLNSMDQPNDESDITLLGNVSKSRSKNRGRWIQALLCATMIIMIALLACLVYIANEVSSIQKAVHLNPSGSELGDCGSSHTVEEARAKGCMFDPMSWLWVRPECYDHELIEDFMNRTEWSWHTDWKLSAENQVPLEAIYRGDHPQLYTAKKYHAIHCTYMWTKMHKALMEHRPVDTDLTSYHHTHHCNQVLANDYLHEDTDCTADMICPTLVRATWTSCGYF